MHSSPPTHSTQHHAASRILPAFSISPVNTRYHSRGKQPWSRRTCRLVRVNPATARIYHERKMQNYALQKGAQCLVYARLHRTHRARIVCVNPRNGGHKYCACDGPYSCARLDAARPAQWKSRSRWGASRELDDFVCGRRGPCVIRRESGAAVLPFRSRGCRVMPLVRRLGGGRRMRRDNKAFYTIWLFTFAMFAEFLDGF